MIRLLSQAGGGTFLLRFFFFQCAVSKVRPSTTEGTFSFEVTSFLFFQKFIILISERADLPSFIFFFFPLLRKEVEAAPPHAIFTSSTSLCLVFCVLILLSFFPFGHVKFNFPR